MNRSLTLVLLLFAAARPAIAQRAPANLDLEAAAPGGAPLGWFVPPVCRQAGYRAATVERAPHGGARCARLWRERPGRAGIGNLMQTVDATPYRSRRIRLRAWVRPALGPGGWARLWLRVDRPGGRRGFFDNMGARPLTGRADWRRVEITGDVAADATGIAFGLMLSAPGEVALDDVTLERLGATGAGDVPPRALSEAGRRNLVALARLLGHVRHFCAADAAATADWEAVARAAVSAVEPAADARALAAALQAQLAPLAPGLRVSAGGRPAARRLSAPPAGGPRTIVVWRHRGYGSGAPRSIYRSMRERVPAAEDGAPPDGVPDPRSPHVVRLAEGVWAEVPLAVHAVGGRTWPTPEAAPPAAAARPEGWRPSGRDRTTRLAGVVLAWNVFAHFYPYLDVVETDWDAALVAALERAAVDPDERAYLSTLRRLVAALEDGHGNVWHASAAVGHTLPVAWDWVGEQLVLTRVGAGVAGLRRGQVVRALDGVPLARRYAEAAAEISGASAGWIRHRALQALAAGPPGNVTLTVAAPGGEPTRVTLARVPFARAPREPRPEKVAEVRPGIMYVDLDRVTDADVAAASARLAAARGLVFDLRGYPGKLSTIVLAHLASRPLRSAKFEIPLIRHPDRARWQWSDGGWPVAPLAPRWTAPAAFVIGPGAISYAETYLEIVREFGLAELVGAATAGTNGNINPFELPGGYRLVWTGMRVRRNDGRRFHGVGVRPTHPAPRTVPGIAAGRDEPLEAAIARVQARAGR